MLLGRCARVTLQGCIDEGDKLYVPIRLPTAVEHPTVLNAIVARIEHVANQISGANLLNRTGNSGDPLV